LKKIGNKPRIRKQGVKSKDSGDKRRTREMKKKAMKFRKENICLKKRLEMIKKSLLTD
jgi:hypothetical protein